jgi:PST family polysaccharide transporter
MSQTLDNIGSRAASGMFWIAGQTAVSRVVGLVAQWILANWLLGPKDFGQIALVYSITTIAGLANNPGLNSVLLQKQRHFNRWATPAFWMSLAFGLAGTVLMALLAAVVIGMAKLKGNLAYGDSSIFWMTLIMASGTPLTAMGTVPMVKLESQMRFARIASIGTAELLLQQILLLTFAALGFGAYSFVMPVPIVAALRTATLWIIAPTPLRGYLGIHRWPALWASTGWILAQRGLIAATSVGDYITIGWLFGNDVLVGQYYFAFNLAMQVVRVLCDNAGSVLMPALSAIHSDSLRTLNATQRASRALAAMVIPIAMLQIVLARPVIHLVYSSKWESSIVLVQLLSFGPLLLAAGWPYGTVLTASGRYRAAFYSWLLNGIAFFVLVIPFSLAWNTRGTAFAVSIWSWLSGMAFALAADSIRGVWGMLSAAMSPLIAATAGAIPAAILVAFMPEGRWINLLTIAMTIPLLCGIYLVMLQQLDRETVQILWNHAGGMFRRIVPRRVPGASM